MSWGWSALQWQALVTVLELRAVFQGLLQFLDVWQGGSVAVMSDTSSVLLSLRWLGLRDRATLVGDGCAAPLGGITGVPSPALVCSWLGLHSGGLSVHSGAARSVGVATPLVCVYSSLASMGVPEGGPFCHVSTVTSGVFCSPVSGSAGLGCGRLAAAVGRSGSV